MHLTISAAQPRRSPLLHTKMTGPLPEDAIPDSVSGCLLQPQAGTKGHFGTTYLCGWRICNPSRDRSCQQLRSMLCGEILISSAMQYHRGTSSYLPISSMDPYSHLKAVSKLMVQIYHLSVETGDDAQCSSDGVGLRQLT